VFSGVVVFIFYCICAITYSHD